MMSLNKPASPCWPTRWAALAKIKKQQGAVLMPLQNRVTPEGTIERDSAKGTFMGNRGVLHDANKELKRQFKSRAWITCLLKFKGRKRELMTPRAYTELFFLDEVTAFSAGHRPCAEC
jgi:hypothetical protein